MFELNYLNTYEKKQLNDKNSNLFHYKITDQIYQSNLNVDVLNSFKINNVETIQSILIELSLSGLSIIFNDNVLIGENQYLVSVETSFDSDYYIKFDDQAYHVNNQIICLRSGKIDNTILSGPVLILHLAMNQVFCLHASSFVMNNKVFILMGDSGTGKSTIARYMNEMSGCERIADDILPMKIVDNQLTVLPNFPQLKLSPDEQYQGDSIVKETILLFAEKSNEETQLKSIENFESLKKVVSHSVATKLFAKDELQNHLSFCHKASALTTSYHIKYQHSEGSLEKFFKLLNEHC